MRVYASIQSSNKLNQVSYCCSSTATRSTKIGATPCQILTHFSEVCAQQFYTAVCSGHQQIKSLNQPCHVSATDTALLRFWV